jgi:redox-sensitive bicupin YhaK (pirin superfamily)
VIAYKATKFWIREIKDTEYCEIRRSSGRVHLPIKASGHTLRLYEAEGALESSEPHVACGAGAAVAAEVVVRMGWKL